MVNYQNGKIYAIRSFKTDEIYIGSTTQSLCRRFQGHKGRKKEYEKGTSKSYYSSFKLLEYDDVYIELIENYPCNSKEELLKKEGEHIRNTNCVNKRVSGRTNKEYREKNKDKIKEYREKNKDKMKEYYEKNKEVIKQRKAIKVKCPHCEKEMRKDSINRHIKNIH